MKATLIFASFMILAATAWTQQTKSTASPTLPPAQESTVTYVGDYQSLRGVMQPLSCYCFDGGILTTRSGRKVNVCFENGELENALQTDDKIQCKRIKVMGVMKEKFYESDGNSPCPSGSMTYLRVTSFRCLD